MTDFSHEAVQDFLGTSAPKPYTPRELLELADLEWQAAVDMGPPHKLSTEDREFQKNNFERSANYARRAADLITG